MLCPNNLYEAVYEAVAGNTIIFQNGTYTTTDEIVITNKKETTSKPIVIKAESIGGVSSIFLNSNCILKFSCNNC